MIQALQFAMTSSTTQIRPHFSKSMDISTLEDSQVLSAFPYDIRFLDLSPEDANDFGLNPLLPVQSSLGIHATVMDSADRAGLDPLDFGKGGKSRRESSKGKGKKGKGKGKGKAHTNAPLYKGRKDDRDDRDDWRDDTPDRSWSKNWNNNRWFTNYGSTQSQGHKSSASKWDKGQQRSSHVVLVCRLCLTCHRLLGFNLNCHECTGAGAKTYFEELVAAGCKVSPDPSPPIPPMECPFGDPPCSTFLGHGACAVCRHLQSLWLRFARHNTDPPLDFLRGALQLALEHRIHGVLKWDTDKSLWDHTYSWIDEVTSDMTAPAPHFTFLRDLTRECYEESWPLPCEPSGAGYAWKPWTPDQIEQGDWTLNFGSLASATYDQTSLPLECFKNALVQYITKWLDNNGFWTTFEFLYPGAEVNPPCHQWHDPLGCTHCPLLALGLRRVSCLEQPLEPGKSEGYLQGHVARLHGPALGVGGRAICPFHLGWPRIFGHLLGPGAACEPTACQAVCLSVLLDGHLLLADCPPLWCAYHREAAETTSQRRAGVPVEFDCGPCPNQPPITVCCPIRQAAPLEQQRKFHGNPPVADVWKLAFRLLDHSPCPLLYAASSFQLLMENQCVLTISAWRRTERRPPGRFHQS